MKGGVPPTHSGANGKVSLSPQKVNKGLLTGPMNASGGALNRTLNPNKSSTFSKGRNTGGSGQPSQHDQAAGAVTAPGGGSMNASRMHGAQQVNSMRQMVPIGTLQGQNVAGQAASTSAMPGSAQYQSQVGYQPDDTGAGPTAQSPMQKSGGNSANTSQLLNQAHKAKIEQKNRMMNQNQMIGRNNKNVTDAQKRIAKIIRDQHTGQQIGASGQGQASGSQGASREQFLSGDRQLPSQQKSRNAAIQQSKSENLLGGQQSQAGSGHYSYKHGGGSLTDQSPKQLLLTQQKRLIEHNSNAHYQTANQLNLSNQSRSVDASAETGSRSNEGAVGYSSSQSDMVPRQSAQSTKSASGVNKLRTSSGVRNKPQGALQLSQQQAASQSSQSSGQGTQQTRQNLRGSGVGASHFGSGGGNQRDKNTSHSQPPGSHTKIERQDKQGHGQGGLQQSKSQNQLTTYRGFIMTVQQQQEYMKMEQEQIDRFIASYHPAKFACKKNGVVSSYSANTHQGIVRNYNEDRVSIILNIIRPKFKQVDEWPRCSFFAVYDGHGGSACADFLRDQLHQLIVRDENFPRNPKLAIERGLAEAEKMFLEWAHQQSRPQEDFVERSGTCAIIVLIVGDICYVANVGDSRAIMSVDGGEKILLLSKDHKPEDEEETRRVEENGGQIYQNKSYVPDPSPDNATGLQMIIGPHRVFPGRLSVSRTIGDIEAKDPRYGGNPMCVVPTPDIKCFRIRSNYDFIILGCDGVFEKQNNKEIINAVWDATRCDFENDEVLRKNVDQNVLKKGEPISIHQKAGLAVDKALHECVFAKTLDNITAVMIAFENYEKIASTDIYSKMDDVDAENYRQMLQRKSLEPVLEEYIEDDAEAPLMFPQVAGSANDHSPSKVSRNESQKRDRSAQPPDSQGYQQYQGRTSELPNASRGSERDYAQGADSQSGTQTNDQNRVPSAQKQKRSAQSKSTLNLAAAGQTQPAGGAPQSNPHSKPKSREGTQLKGEGGHEPRAASSNVRQQNSPSLAVGQQHQPPLTSKNGPTYSTVQHQSGKMIGQSGYGMRDSQQSGQGQAAGGQGNAQPQIPQLQKLNGQGGAGFTRVDSQKGSLGGRMPSTRATSDSQAMGMRKSGSSNMEVSGMAGQGANPSASSSMLYALTHSGMQGRDKFVQGPSSGGQGGTPIRGASGSTRRKIVAQQSHQHFKKHLNGSGAGSAAAASSTFRDGTPKERHGHQIPQIGLGSASNRVKSSRQSERASASGAPGQGGQPRAITPKQAQKMYSSINVQKNTRGSSQSKLNLGSDPANYLTQNPATVSTGQPYSQSMQNLGSGKRGQTNMSAVTGNEYHHGSGKHGASGAGGGQLVGLSGGMAGMSIGGLAKSSKVIPKKEWRDQNFNTTQPLKPTQGSSKNQINMNPQSITALQNGYNQLHGNQGAGSGLLAAGGQNFNSSQNVKLKFEKTANLANIGSLTNSKGQVPTNLSATMIPMGVGSSNVLAGNSGSSFVESSNGRYKKKSSGGALQGNLISQSIVGQNFQQQHQMAGGPGSSKGLMTMSHKQMAGNQGQQRMLEKHDYGRGSGQQLPGSGKTAVTYQSLPGGSLGGAREARNSSHNQKTAGATSKSQVKLSSHSSRNQNGIKSAYTSGQISK